MFNTDFNRINQWLTKVLVGNIDGLKFEEKLLRFGAMLSFVFTALSMIVNLFVQNDFMINFFGVVTTLIYLGIYLVSRIKHSYYVLYYFLMIMTLFSVFLAWRYFDGFDGPALYIIIMLSLFYSLLTKGIHSVIVLCVCILFVLTLSLYDYYYPDTVLNYPDTASKMTDIIFTVSVSMIFTFVVVKIVFNRYLEREKVHEDNLLLEEKNRFITENMIQLRDINSQKDKFFSIVSHDLRAPFSGFLGLSELLRTEADSLSLDEIKEVSAAMHTSASKLYSLLDELLQWSMSQMGKIEFKPELLNLNELIENTVYFLHQEADKKKINIKIESEMDIIFNGDMNMIISILRNLVMNAIKFTNPGGKIKIFASKDNNHFKLKVSDNGVGIDEVKLTNLFEIVSSNSTQGTSGELGTGLGLILCKEFVSKHGGDIFVDSIVGKGSTFTCRIPLNYPLQNN